MISQTRLSQFGTVLLVTTALSVTGCVSTVSQQFGLTPTLDASDACYDQWQALRRSGGALEEDYFANAVAGGVIAALTTAAVQTIRSGEINWGGIAAASAVGALSGLAATYLQSRAEQAETEQALFRSIAGDIQNTNRQIDASQIAFNRLSDCRQREANGIRQQFAAGQLSREEADAQLGDVRDKFKGDLALAKRINDDIQERRTAYNETTVALNDNVRGSDTPEPSAQPIEPTTYAVRVNSRVRQGPSTSTTQIGGLRGGSTVTVTGRQGEWLRVRLTNGRTGFVASRLLAAPGTPEYRTALATGANAPVPPASSVDEPDELVPLAQSNVTKAEQYDQTIQVAEAEVDSGFDLDGPGLSYRLRPDAIWFG